MHSRGSVVGDVSLIDPKITHPLNLTGVKNVRHFLTLLDLKRHALQHIIFYT